MHCARCLLASAGETSSSPHDGFADGKLPHDGFTDDTLREARPIGEIIG